LELVSVSCERYLEGGLGNGLGESKIEIGVVHHISRFFKHFLVSIHKAEGEISEARKQHEGFYTSYYCHITKN
jgi:hypothetical protein